MQQGVIADLGQQDILMSRQNVIGDAIKTMICTNKAGKKDTELVLKVITRCKT